MDQSQAAIVQQSELLRDIREELRTSRSAMVAAASGSPSAGATGRSTGFVARAQAMSDRVMAGDFANFGWTQAFSPIYRTTAFQDVGALMGISRAPSVLTQPEYESLAAENLGIRSFNLAAGIIAPGFASRSNALSNEIFANSPRFARFGSSSSVLGVGMSRTASMDMARRIQVEALGDLRLSPTDYSTVATVGMQTGQFDNIGSAGDFMTRMRELATAVGDVTRTLRMSAEEAAKTLGSLRSVGITDIGVQRSTVMGIGAAAQVAGMTSSEMMGLAFNGASLGVGLGLSGQSSMLGVSRLAAQMREASQAGVVDKFIMARGGGAAAVASNIFEAEARFASSDAGFYSFIGRQGGGSDYIGDLTAGVQAVAGGGFHGVLRSQRTRAEMTSRMTDEDRRQGLLSYTRQQIGLFGINDTNSSEARDIAFQVARSAGMDENAAIAYTNSNFSEDGRRATERARINSFRAQDVMDRKLVEDRLYSHTSFAGRFARARASLSQGYTEFASDFAENFRPGASGYGFNSISGVYQQSRAAQAGLVSHNLSAAQLGSAINRGTLTGGLEVYNNTGGSAGFWGSVIGGVGAGAAAGFLAGGIGVIPGALIGAAAGTAGWFAGEYIGSAIDASGNGSIKLRGAQAKAYSEMARSLGRTNMESGRKVLSSGKLSNSVSFRALLDRGAEMGQLNAKDSIRLSSDIERVQQETGASITEITDALMATGVSVTTADAFDAVGGGAMSKDYVDRLQTLLADQGDTSVNFMIGENAEALRQYLAASGKGGSTGDFASARSRLAAAGVNSRALDGILENYRDMSQSERQSLLKGAENQVRFGANQQFHELMSGAQGLADALIGEAEGSKEAGAGSLRTQFDNLVGQGDRAALFRAVTSDTEVGSFLRRKSKVFSDAYDAMSADIGAMSAKDISARYGLDTQFTEQLKRDLETDPSKIGEVRSGLAAAILAARGSAEGGEGIDREREIARNLSEASRVLKGLTDRVLNRGTAK